MATQGSTSGTPRGAWPVLTLLLLWALPVVASAQAVGPARGALVVSGGGETTSHIIDSVIELAGGPDAPIVVVPTSGRSDEDYHEFCPCLRRFREAGATNLSVMHTRDRSVANTDAFVEPLRRARGLWLNGGSHWLHTDAYLDTKVHEELVALLDRGGVIGGGSAGAHVQGEIMNVSRSPEREFSERTLPREDWRRGFALLRGRLQQNSCCRPAVIRLRNSFPPTIERFRRRRMCHCCSTHRSKKSILF